QQGVPALGLRIIRQDCAQAARLIAALAHSGAASWRSAMLEDSRYVREAALAQAGTGRAWVRQWMVSAERDARSTGAAVTRADARDVVGLLAGVDRSVAADWHLGLFAGAQHVDYSSAGHVRAPGVLALRDASLHLGLGLSRSLAGHRLSLGAAHAWHRGEGRRWTVDGDDTLRATQHARSLQAWAEWRLEVPPADHWTFTPLARLAWVRLDSRDYVESGGPAALRVQGAVDQRIFAHAALHANRTWAVPHGSAVLRATLGWDGLLGAAELDSVQAFREDAAGRWFAAGGQPLARHALRFDASVDAPL